MDAESLANLLCRDVVHSVARRDVRQFIVTRFRYPDGEYVPLYVTGAGDHSVISDLGTTLFKCTVNRIVVTDQRKDFIEAVCRRYGVRFEEDQLLKTVMRSTAGADCLAFCEAVARISSIQMDLDSRKRSTLPEEVERLLDREVSPKRSVSLRWSHPEFDPGGDFPVDFHVNGMGEPRNIFHVGTPAKSTLVAAVANFLRLNRVYAPTLAIVDFDVYLGRHYLSRLQRATTEIRYGLKGNEKDVVKFSLGGMGEGVKEAEPAQPKVS